MARSGKLATISCGPVLLGACDHAPIAASDDELPEGLALAIAVPPDQIAVGVTVYRIRS